MSLPIILFVCHSYYYILIDLFQKFLGSQYLNEEEACQQV